MAEPDFRTSRITIALGFLAVLAVGGGGFLVGRNTAPRPHPSTTAPAPIPALNLPRERPLLGRADFIALAAKAADAFASGQAMPQEVTDAAGRRFDLVLPVGCAASGDPSLSATDWSYDKDRGRLRISIPPIGWKPADWNLDENAKVDSIEGFWITRPWSSSDACPPAPPTGEAEEPEKPAEPAATADKEQGTEPLETLAVAQFFTPEGTSSIRRGGRPYSIVARIAPDAFDASQGFRLRLTGRIDRVPGGAAAQCVQPAGRDNPPICIIATVLDEVRVENTATGAVLATWSANHSSR